MLTALQQIILGIAQGITEWLPISSSGMSTLIMSNFFGITNLHDLITTALFLHLGTFLAALIYFRKEVINLFKTFFRYKISDDKSKNTLKFIIITTLISGFIGLIILRILDSLSDSLEITGKVITLIVGLMLLVTGLIQIGIKRKGLRTERNIKNSDSILLGFMQGLSTLPGISRSGITVSTMLLKKFDDTTALKLSFLMSLPIVLIANIILNLEDLIFTSTAIYGLLASFVFGIATIHGLIKISKKINFGWFILIFAILMLLSLLFV